ncbi:hypothetical protein AVEN_24448-1, partial [Araneus ventricosus]
EPHGNRVPKGSAVSRLDSIQTRCDEHLIHRSQTPTRWGGVKVCKGACVVFIA